MERYKYDENNGLWYELGEHGMYYPMVEEIKLESGRYVNLAMEHMRAISPIEYETLGLLGKFPEIFNGLNDKVYALIDEIMKKKLIEEPIQENWNVLEMEKHKKMLYREAEEVALQEIVYKNHFENIDIEAMMDKV